MDIYMSIYYCHVDASEVTLLVSYIYMDLFYHVFCGLRGYQSSVSYRNKCDGSFAS